MRLELDIARFYERFSSTSRLKFHIRISQVSWRSAKLRMCLALVTVTSAKTTTTRAKSVACEYQKYFESRRFISH